MITDILDIYINGSVNKKQRTTFKSEAECVRIRTAKKLSVIIKRCNMREIARRNGCKT